MYQEALLVYMVFGPLSLPEKENSRDENDGAGEGNRTLVVSLGSFCSTIELHPRVKCGRNLTMAVLESDFSLHQRRGT